MFNKVNYKLEKKNQKAVKFLEYTIKESLDELG